MKFLETNIVETLRPPQWRRNPQDWEVVRQFDNRLEDLRTQHKTHEEHLSPS